MKAGLLGKWWRIYQLLVSFSVFTERWTLLSEINLLLTPDKERGDVFEKIRIIGFRTAKSLKEIFVRAKVQPLEKERKIVAEHAEVQGVKYANNYWNNWAVLLHPFSCRACYK